MDMKFRVEDKEHSAAIQEALFKLGYSWGVVIDNKVCNTFAIFLYASENDITWDDSASFFDEDPAIEFILDGSGQITQKKKTVFLGGTCNNSKWREELIPMLTCDYFNPVVETWTEQDYQNELQARNTCDILLYVLTPEMTGVYSVAEVVDDSNKHPHKTALIVFDEYGGKSFEPFQKKAMEKVKLMVSGNGGNVFSSFEEFVNFVGE